MAWPPPTTRAAEVVREAEFADRGVCFQRREERLDYWQVTYFEPQRFCHDVTTSRPMFVANSSCGEGHLYWPSPLLYLGQIATNPADTPVQGVLLDGYLLTLAGAFALAFRRRELGACFGPCWYLIFPALLASSFTVFVDGGVVEVIVAGVLTYPVIALSIYALREIPDRFGPDLGAPPPARL